MTPFFSFFFSLSVAAGKDKHDKERLPEFFWMFVNFKCITCMILTKLKHEKSQSNLIDVPRGSVEGGGSAATSQNLGGGFWKCALRLCFKAGASCGSVH